MTPPVNRFGDAMVRAGVVEDTTALRDWFAGMFASSIPLDIADRIAAPDLPAYDEENENPNEDTRYVVPRAEIARRLAVSSYFLADAMLKARAPK